MKKIVVLFQFVLILVLSSNTFAQNTKSDKVELGLRFAPNISWMKPSAQDYNSEGSLLKFSWGLVSDIKFARNYYFSTGFNIIACGGKISFPSQITTSTGTALGTMNETYYLRYLEIPLSVKMKTRQFGYFTLYGQLGLSLGLNIRAIADQQFLPANSSITIVNNDVNVRDQINDFKLSLIVAAGTEYSLGGSTNLFGELRFNNGFTNILSFDNPMTPNNSPYAISNSFELAVGIMF